MKILRFLTLLICFLLLGMLIAPIGIFAEATSSSRGEPVLA